VKPKIAVALLSVTVLFLSACSSTPIDTPSVSATKPATSTLAAQPSATPKAAAAASVALVALPAYLDPKNPISIDRSVYFDFDEFVVREKYTPLIERHARYLASTPAVAIKIEGNTDERGSSEYDLALGQRRADAVMRTLKLLGVKDTQMEAISWGKEKPKATDHDEAAWAQNRRADVVYPAR
jgi:peptidoglycan-associated lipoprotein